MHVSASRAVLQEGTLGGKKMRVVAVRRRVWFGKSRGAWASASSDPEWLRPEVDSLDCSGMG